MFCEGGVDVVGVVYTPWRSSTGFPWRSGKEKRKQGRTGGSRRGEAT